MPYLWQTNLEAWNLYWKLNSRFVVDFQALPLVFELYQPTLTRKEAQLLFEKLCLIHDTLSAKSEEENGNTEK